MMQKWSDFVDHKTLIIGIVACLNKNKKFLLVRRGPTDIVNPGYWEFPGGHIDDSDDSIEAGAARELEEEANLKVLPSNLIYLGLTHQIKPSLKDPNTGMSLRKHFFLALEWKNEATIVPNPQRGILEHDDLQWRHKSYIQSIENTEIPIYLVDKALKIQKRKQNDQN